MSTSRNEASWKFPPATVGRFRSESVAETEAFGERIGRRAERGLVIGLSGDLGAGKTALVRGIARGLGCTTRVHSPTFALLNEYGGGRWPLFHLDLYRLHSPAEIEGAGLAEYLSQPEGISVVEWIERWTDAVPAGEGWWNLRLTALDETTREIFHDVPGA